MQDLSIFAALLETLAHGVGNICVDLAISCMEKELGHALYQPSTNWACHVHRRNLYFQRGILQCFGLACSMTRSIREVMKMLTLTTLSADTSLFDYM